MKSIIKKILDLFTVDKYYEMSDEALEKEAAKWHIGGYSDGHFGIINRQIITHALVEKDKANNSRIAIFISIIALVISILGIILK